MRPALDRDRRGATATSRCGVAPRSASGGRPWRKRRPSADRREDITLAAAAICSSGSDDTCVAKIVHRLFDVGAEVQSRPAAYSRSSDRGRAGRCGRDGKLELVDFSAEGSGEKAERPRLLRRRQEAEEAPSQAVEPRPAPCYNPLETSPARSRRRSAAARCFGSRLPTFSTTSSARTCHAGVVEGGAARRHRDEDYCRTCRRLRRGLASRPRPSCTSRRSAAVDRRVARPTVPSSLRVAAWITNPGRSGEDQAVEEPFLPRLRRSGRVR